MENYEKIQNDKILSILKVKYRGKKEKKDKTLIILKLEYRKNR